MEMVEFAVAQKINKEPAFNWWVPHVLKKREAIIKLVKSWKTGIDLSRFLKSARTW